MPIHDWTRVDAAIFHAFHHDWITELARALNRQVLPEDYYALPEQWAAGVGPDVLTLQTSEPDGTGAAPSGQRSPAPAAGKARLCAPQLVPTAHTDLAFYRRKQKVVTVRHVSGDRIVAVVEIVSPGNESARNPLRAFVQKAAELIANGVHLLLIDLHPPGRRDPEEIHPEVWEEISGEECARPAGKPLTVASYEAGDEVNAYVKNVAAGDVLPDMPLFLEPGQAVMVPLEETYMTTFLALPRRWQRVVEVCPQE